MEQTCQKMLKARLEKRSVHVDDFERVRLVTNEARTLAVYAQKRS